MVIRGELDCTSLSFRLEIVASLRVRPLVGPRVNRYKDDSSSRKVASLNDVRGEQVEQRAGASEVAIADVTRRHTFS